MNLTIENVEKVFFNCLFKDGEDTTNHIRVDGVVRKIGFHPERIKEYEEEIQNLLSQLPNQFSEGGGWSFLKMPFNMDNEMWGDQPHAEMLMGLGMAINKVRYLLPRELWIGLPGGVPYVTVDK